MLLTIVNNGVVNQAFENLAVYWQNENRVVVFNTLFVIFLCIEPTLVTNTFITQVEYANTDHIVTMETV